MSASQTSGPAPLAVAFDATGTLGLAADDYVGATFIWDFGDPASGVWQASGKPKNTSRGFVTGHVYELPGAYQARVRVIDRSGARSAELLIPITVTSPNSVYAQTYCISSSGTDTSCANGAIALSSVTQIPALAGPNKRFLIQRGLAQTVVPAFALQNVQGPLYIGAYGAGAVPRLTFPTTNIEAAFYVTNSARVVIEDLAIVGPDAVHGQDAPIGLWMDSDSTLLQRLQVTGFDRNIHFAGSSTSPLRFGNVVSDSGLFDAGYFALTISGNFRLTTILGNTFHDSVQGFVRVLESQKTHIGHNLFQGSFAVKSHSGNMVVADNVFDGGTFSRIAYGTGGGGVACDAATKMHHLVDGNLFLGVSPDYSGGVDGIHIGCGGNFVVRANGFLNVPSAVAVDGSAFESGFQGPLPVRVLNNYSADDRAGNSASSFMTVSNPYPRTDVRNNVVYFPALNFTNGDHTSVLLLASASLANLTADHNLWYLPASNGGNASTPGLFVKSGSYPGHVGYSSTISSTLTVPYFGTLRPIADWRALGLDLHTLFTNPGALIIAPDGRLTLSPASVAFGSGDPVAPFHVDLHGRERPAGVAAPIGAFNPSP